MNRTKREFTKQEYDILITALQTHCQLKFQTMPTDEYVLAAEIRKKLSYNQKYFARQNN